MKIVIEHVTGRYWGELANTLKTPIVLMIPQHRLFIQDSRLLLKMVRLGLRPTMLLHTSDRWLEHLGYKGYRELP